MLPGIPTSVQEPEHTAEKAVDGDEAAEEEASLQEEEIEEDFENSDTPWKCLEGKVKWVGRNES